LDGWRAVDQGLPFYGNLTISENRMAKEIQCWMDALRIDGTERDIEADLTSEFTLAVKELVSKVDQVGGRYEMRLTWKSEEDLTKPCPGAPKK
jgi:hypothetical protein